MDPSWLQVGSSWTPAGPKLGPTWLKLGPCWTHFISGSPAPLGPTQALPNPFPVASGPPKLPFVPYKPQHRSQTGSQTSNLEFKSLQHTPKLNLKPSLPGPQLLLAHCYYYCYSRTGGMGRSLLEYIFTSFSNVFIYAFCIFCIIFVCIFDIK